MFARAGLVALALALAWPAWAESDYPARLFENSPVIGSRAAVSRQASKDLPSQAKEPGSERASGACHHHREWRYPWPQPC